MLRKEKVLLIMLTPLFIITTVGIQSDNITNLRILKKDKCIEEFFFRFNGGDKAIGSWLVHLALFPVSE
jgi:hypothetical protein